MPSGGEHTLCRFIFISSRENIVGCSILNSLQTRDLWRHFVISFSVARTYQRINGGAPCSSFTLPFADSYIHTSKYIA